MTEDQAFKRYMDFIHAPGGWPWTKEKAQEAGKEKARLRKAWHGLYKKAGKCLCKPRKASDGNIK